MQVLNSGSVTIVLPNGDSLTLPNLNGVLLCASSKCSFTLTGTCTVLELKLLICQALSLPKHASVGDLILEVASHPSVQDTDLLAHVGFLTHPVVLVEYFKIPTHVCHRKFSQRFPARRWTITTWTGRAVTLEGTSFVERIYFSSSYIWRTYSHDADCDRL